MPDEAKTLQCRDCGVKFPFTVGEQEWYKSQKFAEPRRCRDCRKAKKRANEAAGKK